MIIKLINTLANITLIIFFVSCDQEEDKSSKIDEQLDDTTVVEKDGTVEDDKKDKVDFGLLNYKKLINCDNIDCLNDSDFIPIYGILGGILLLGVFQSKRQSRVVISWVKKIQTKKS